MLPAVIADRRWLHQQPELRFQEHETARFVAARLQALGVSKITTGVGGTGVTALIHGSAPGKVLALRADMDALPIEEQNDVPYRSTVPGLMHACGHDAHVAMLLGVAAMLQQRSADFAGTIKLIFQPAEERGGGALAMIDDGVLEQPAPDAVLGLHIWQELDLGVVAARAGTALVAGDMFTIDVTGIGGHGAQPNLCVDPIAIGAAIVTALQTIVSRERDPTMPGVVSIGAFHAGLASNVIPNTAELQGTFRSVTQDQRERTAARIAEIASAVAGAMRGSAEVSVHWGGPPTVNDPALTELVKSAARDVVGASRTIDGPLLSVSDDVAELLARVPGCYFFVGSRNRDRGLTWGHHHPRFDIDEDAMAIGVEVMTRAALAFLGNDVVTVRSSSSQRLTVCRTASSMSGIQLIV